MTPVIKFVKAKDERAWASRKFHPLLYEVVDHFLSLCARYGINEVICTSGIRTVAEDRKVDGSGVHLTGRAIDFAKAGIPNKVFDEIDAALDASWVYDPWRPKKPLSYTDPHGTGPHFHLQVTDRTRRVM